MKILEKWLEITIWRQLNNMDGERGICIHAISRKICAISSRMELEKTALQVSDSTAAMARFSPRQPRSYNRTSPASDCHFPFPLLCPSSSSFIFYISASPTPPSLSFSLLSTRTIRVDLLDCVETCWEGRKAKRRGE